MLTNQAMFGSSGPVIKIVCTSFYMPDKMRITFSGV